MKFVSSHWRKINLVALFLVGVFFGSGCTVMLMGNMLIGFAIALICPLICFIMGRLSERKELKDRVPFA